MRGCSAAADRDDVGDPVAHPDGLTVTVRAAAAAGASRAPPGLHAQARGFRGLHAPGGAAHGARGARGTARTADRLHAR